MIVLFALVLAALSASGNVVVTKLGETANLECGVSNFGDLAWRHGDDKILSIYSRTGATSKGNSNLAKRSRLKQANLEISKVEMADAGQFSCQAGRHDRQIELFVVSVSASPSHVLEPGSEATLQCEVNVPNAETQVQWTKPDGSVHTEDSGLASAHLKSVSISDAGTWKCRFSYRGQTYDQNLVVTVNVPTPPTPPSTDHKGSVDNNGGGPGNGVHLGQPTHRPHVLLLGLIWWMWVAIGVGCLVVVVLLILVICFFRRNRRKKRKIQQMKNGLHLRTPVQYCQCGCPTAAAKPQQRRRREKPSAPRYELPPGGVTQKAAHERERRERE